MTWSIGLALANVVGAILVSQSSNHSNSVKCTIFIYIIGYISEVLQKALVGLFENYECSSFYDSYSNSITDGMICAGYEQGGIDTCQVWTILPRFPWSFMQKKYIMTSQMLHFTPSYFPITWLTNIFKLMNVASLKIISYVHKLVIHHTYTRMLEK